MQKPQKSVLVLFLLASCATVPRHAAPTTEATVTTQAPATKNIFTRQCYMVTETMGDDSAPLDTQSRWLRKICDWYSAPKYPVPKLMSQTQPPALRAEN